jgi:hypothetical protein
MAEPQPTSPPASTSPAEGVPGTQPAQPPPNPPVNPAGHLANFVQKGADPTGQPVAQPPPNPPIDPSTHLANHSQRVCGCTVDIAAQPAPHLANLLTLDETRTGQSPGGEPPSKPED